MITLKGLKIPTVTKKKISLSSFLTKASISENEMLRSLSEVATLYNFDCSDGTLRSGIGIKEFEGNNKLSLSEGEYPKNIYFYKRYDLFSKKCDDRLIIFTSLGYLYSLPLNGEDELVKISNDAFTAPPVAISYNFFEEDVLILSFSEEGMYILNGNDLSKIEGAPKITSMCIHSERLFATSQNEGTALWFSDDFNPTNWSVSLDEAGYIELPDDRGKLLKVISFLDYVYVFREYGISRIYAYGDQSSFSVDNLYSSVGKIYSSTVTECGGYVIFLSSSGLYRFNGIEAQKILPFYDSYLLGVDNECAKGVFYNGKLYLKLNMKIKNKIENAVLVYDVESKVPYIARGLKIDGLELVASEKYEILATSMGKLCILDGSGKRFLTPLKKVWESGSTDFFIDTEKKTLQKIHIMTAEPITLYVECDGKTSVYSILEGENKVKLSLTGRVFKFKIISRTKSPKILKPCFYFSYVKESLW